MGCERMLSVVEIALIIRVMHSSMEFHRTSKPTFSREFCRPSKFVFPSFSFLGSVSVSLVVPRTHLRRPSSNVRCVGQWNRSLVERPRLCASKNLPPNASLRVPESHRLSLRFGADSRGYWGTSWEMEGRSSVDEQLPELAGNQEKIERILGMEEEFFWRAVAEGKKLVASKAKKVGIFGGVSEE